MGYKLASATEAVELRVDNEKGVEVPAAFGSLKVFKRC